MTPLTTCRCLLANGRWIGQSDGQILYIPSHGCNEPKSYRFTDTSVQWLLVTPNNQTAAAGHDCGLVIVFDIESGKMQDANTCQLRSEYKRTAALTTGRLSNNGRWLLACTQSEEKDTGFLLDLHQQHTARRLVLPHCSRTHTPPTLQHRFVMLAPHHPTLLQCRIQTPVPLRQVQVELVCADHMALTGHHFDRQIDEQLFQKDLLPDQFNAISWRIDMPVRPPAGSWLCTAVLTVRDDDGQVSHHLLPLDMPLT